MLFLVLVDKFMRPMKAWTRLSCPDCYCRMLHLISLVTCNVIPEPQRQKKISPRYPPSAQTCTLGGVCCMKSGTRVLWGCVLLPMDVCSQDACLLMKWDLVSELSNPQYRYCVDRIQELLLMHWAELPYILIYCAWGVDQRKEYTCSVGHVSILLRAVQMASSIHTRSTPVRALNCTRAFLISMWSVFL